MNKPLSPLVRPTQVRYIVLAWLCSLSMITYIDRVCIMQVKDDIRDELRLTDQEISWAFSAFALAYALCEVPTGWLGDRLGARRVLTRIVSCWLLFTALTGAVWNWTSLIVVRTLFGAGEAGAYPNIARATRNWFPYRQRGLAQGMIWTFGRLGGGIAPLLVILLAAATGWRGAFVCLALLGVAWLVGFSWWFRDRPDEHPDVNDAERALIAEGRPTSAAPAPLSWATMLRSPTLWSLSGMYFCSNAGWSFFITWVPDYLKKDLGLTGMTLHLASGGPLLLGAVGCLLGGLLTDRQVRIWGPRWGRTLQGTIAYALGGSLFLTSYALTKVDGTLAFTALCFASLLKDMGMGASWSTTLDIGHRYSGSVAGVMNTVGNMGTVVSPPVVAAIVSATATAAGTEWRVALFYYAGMFFVASICWLFINPRRVIVYAPEDLARLRAEGVLE
jgi:MFS family permease